MGRESELEERDVRKTAYKAEKRERERDRERETETPVAAGV